MFPTMGNNVKKLREAAHLTHEALADKMGISKGMLVKLERGERELKVRYIESLARALSIRQGPIIEEIEPIPIIGALGPNSEVSLFEGDRISFEVAPALEGSMPPTVAINILGDSLGPIFDGWLLYYDDLHLPPTGDLVGNLSVLGTEDGRTLIKHIARSRGYSRFDVWSSFQSPTFDVLVKWAAKVRAIRPR